LTIWIAVSVIVLVTIGLGAGLFFSGLFRGRADSWAKSLVQNATKETNQFVENKTRTSSNLDLGHRVLADIYRSPFDRA
jgi:uncharacterized protein HemX